MANSMVTGTLASIPLHNIRKNSINGRTVAILIADGVDADALYAVRKILEDGGALISLIAPSMLDVITTGNRLARVDQQLLLANPREYDAVFIPGGDSVYSLCNNPQAIEFVTEAYKRNKVIATAGEGTSLLVRAAQLGGFAYEHGNFGTRIIHYHEQEGSAFFDALVTAIADQDIAIQ